MTDLGVPASNENWLLLTDYASKYRISVSTLRRRIKNHQIKFRFESGRYYILDEYPGADHSRDFAGASANPNPSPSGSSRGVSHTAPPSAYDQTPLSSEMAEEHLHELGSFHFGAGAVAHPEKVQEPIISTATRLLNELKRAYTNVLQEKEEQLIQLKEEVSDLKTLVRVLEDENERLKKILQTYDIRYS